MEPVNCTHLDTQDQYAKGMCYKCYRKSRGRKHPERVGEWWHGTQGGYVNHGCRCDPCREARNAYQREWRQSRMGGEA